MIPIPLTWAAIAVGVALIVGGLSGYKFEKGRWDADTAAHVLAASKIETTQRTESSKVETVYIDRIKTVGVPRDVVRTRLVRVACGLPNSAASGVPVPAVDPAKPADAAAPADASSGLADDLTAASQNAVQLEQLQALIRANSP